MYLFHGTSERDAINIIHHGFRKKEDLKGSKECLDSYGRIKLGYEWDYFLGAANFFSTQPCRVGLTWEERFGGDPLNFAKQSPPWNLSAPGSLIVLYIPPSKISISVVAIYRNSDVEKYYPLPLGDLSESRENFEELQKRKLKKPTANCQVAVSNSAVNDFILFGFRVYTGEGFVKKFNPKHQTKEKHKRKSMKSLIWHEVLGLSKIYTGESFYRKYA
ncbi:MAG: hypothetical protein KJ886_03270 [Candidatus Thermoplasmatota archaeon]|nr:hypothetical protein [Candidatus Thermoplasmatota archaeon]MBU4256258.1 hypothetical protein [Candidatus Thermoplasmatota archaeon]MCG2826481.1 hypothetical protein [Thermoplasmatales archaeon]